MHSMYCMICATLKVLEGYWLSTNASMSITCCSASAAWSTTSIGCNTASCLTQSYPDAVRYVEHWGVLVHARGDKGTCSAPGLFIGHRTGGSADPACPGLFGQQAAAQALARTAAYCMRICAAQRPCQHEPYVHQARNTKNSQSISEPLSVRRSTAWSYACASWQAQGACTAAGCRCLETCAQAVHRLYAHLVLAASRDVAHPRQRLVAALLDHLQVAHLWHAPHLLLIMPIHCVYRVTEQHWLWSKCKSTLPHNSEWL